MIRPTSLLPAFAACLMATRVFGVYAPIPEMELGKPLTIYASGGAYYDSNIFGASQDEVGSMIYQVSPRFVFNLSADKQTFLSASYQLSLDYFDDRPGDQLLDSHLGTLSVKHTFNPKLSIEVNELFQLSKNPESLLPGLSTVLNTDQSYAFNQLEGRLFANLTKRNALIVKARNARFAYDNDSLAEDLDRSEYLGGLELTHALFPEVRLSAEYRHQTINYVSGGGQKNKDSDFALIGADHVLNAWAALSGRLGGEYRRRKGAEDELFPYVELAAKADYAKGAYVSAGYGFSVEEVSNLDIYTDMSVHRFFVNVQHTLTPRVVAKGSLTWEPSVLNGRPELSPDRDETNTMLGLAILFVVDPRYTLSARLDWDHVDSEDAGRMLERTRGGASFNWVF